MSDTPRVDAEALWAEALWADAICSDEQFQCVPVDFARTLERELAEAQAEVERRFGIGGELIAARRERDEARKDAERYRWLKECTNEQFAYLEKEWCGLDNAIDYLMAAERNA